MKRIAIIFSHPPHGNSKGREALDLALALSDINHISVFFVEDGVFHLLPDQQPDKILMRDYISTLAMLDLYDITDIYVCSESWLERNLIAYSTVIDAKAITKSDIATLLASFDSILTF